MANSVDPDQRPLSAASDLGLHCLQRPVCPNTWVYHGTHKTILRNNQLKIECKKCHSRRFVYITHQTMCSTLDKDYDKHKAGTSGHDGHFKLANTKVQVEL